MTETNDHERAMSVLIHDLRTPLGVASGYLRLVREGRVPQNIEPAVLLDRALEALRAVSRLCVDADRWLDGSPAGRPATTPAVPLLSMLSAGLATRQMTLEGVDGIPAGDLLVVGDASELADAFAEALCAAARPAIAAAHVECTSQPEELVITVRTANGNPNHATAFDPWRCPGLQVAIACRTIVRAGGHWTSAGPDRFRVALPWASALADRPTANGAVL